MKVIITGGAGFIGCNAASRYLRAGNEVVVVDNLSRRGAERNLDWLQGQGDLTFIPADIRSSKDVGEVFRRHRDVDRILHLAGQVAVTTSVLDPVLDFEINALGTFNVLEAIRASEIEAPLIYSSTNKVYGEMNDVGILRVDGHYSYEGLPEGVPEERGLDFHSPYGCSKGAADQYVIDYHRIYGLRTIVLRQSCIYGWRQFGMEDQGWLAWFMIATRLGRKVTVYGDGCQVRDVLFVDDLLDAYDAAFVAGVKAYGRAYNVGGGPKNTLSLKDLLAYIAERTGDVVPHSFDDWRPGDQRVFISDIRRAEDDLGWKPKIGVRRGLGLLFDWVSENRELFEEALLAVA